MSNSPISLSSDLSRLKAEGFEIEIVADHLVIRNVPYVNAAKQIRRGTLVSTLNMSGNVTQKPETHVIMFAGEMPCDKNGAEFIVANEKQRKRIAADLFIDFTFSRKPTGGYPDYYEKITAYVAILESQAQVIDLNAKARTWQVVANKDQDSPFHYLDTASSRAGITAASRKLKGKVAILGLGGTGSYTLDLVAKTPVPEIQSVRQGQVRPAQRLPLAGRAQHRASAHGAVQG